MHANDLIEYLAGNEGKLECSRAADGSLFVSLTITSYGEELNTIGKDIDSVVASSQRSLARFLKRLGTVRIGGKRAK